MYRHWYPPIYLSLQVIIASCWEMKWTFVQLPYEFVPCMILWKHISKITLSTSWFISFHFKRDSECDFANIYAFIKSHSANSYGMYLRSTTVCQWTWWKQINRKTREYILIKPRIPYFEGYIMWLQLNVNNNIIPFL